MNSIIAALERDIAGYTAACVAKGIDPAQCQIVQRLQRALDRARARQEA